MTEKKREMCAEFGPEDGQDPRDFHRKPDARPTNRKALQLCAQIRDSLTWILGTECQDPVLSQLDVIEVQPAPTTARVLVLVSPAMSADIDVGEIDGRLQKAMGLLRSAVAKAIHRKKTPELTFAVVPR